jgi:hypothetical protein
MQLERRHAWLLVGAAAWTWYIWITRMWNILADPGHPPGFKAVHLGLALVSVVLLGLVGRLGILALLAERRKR